MNIKDRINIVFTELNFETIANENSKVEEYKAPTKIKLLPSSPIVGRNGRKYSFEVEEILLNFENNKLEIPIDINHATEIKASQGEYAPAYGWVKSLEADTDGNIWGNVEWNSEWPLKYKEYKYYSPAVNSNLSGKINRITSVGLVNKPNFEDLLALNFENEPSINNQGGIKVDKEILNSLGLNDGANKDEVIQAISNLKNNQASQSQLMETINTLNMELANSKVEKFNDKKMQAIETAVKNGKILPATKELYITTLNSEDSLQTFIDTMDKSPSILGNSIKNPNTETGNTSLNSEDAEYCKKYGLDFDVFKKKKEELFG